MNDLLGMAKRVGAGLLFFFHAVMAFSADPPAPTSTPKAAITVMHGKDLVEEIGFNKLLRLSSEDARHGSKAKSLVWEISPKLESWQPDTKTWFVVSPATDGEIVITQTVALGDEFDTLTIRIKVGNGPQPPPLVDPNVDPNIKPDVKPVTTSVRILLLRNPIQNMSKDQINAINSPAVEDILDAKCMKDSVNRPAWRRWDRDKAIETIPAEWKQLYTKSKEEASAKSAALPVLCVEQGARLTLYEIKTEADVLSALNKTFGGVQ